jgi:hypothetical protein
VVQVVVAQEDLLLMLLEHQVKETMVVKVVAVVAFKLVVAAVQVQLALMPQQLAEPSVKVLEEQVGLVQTHQFLELLQHMLAVVVVKEIALMLQVEQAVVVQVPKVLVALQEWLGLLIVVVEAVVLMELQVYQVLADPA